MKIATLIARSLLGLMFLVFGLMAPAGLPPGLLALALWGFVFYGVRSAFAGIFASQGTA